MNGNMLAELGGPLDSTLRAGEFGRIGLGVRMGLRLFGGRGRWLIVSFGDDESGTRGSGQRRRGARCLCLLLGIGVRLFEWAVIGIRISIDQ